MLFCHHSIKVLLQYADHRHYWNTSINYIILYLFQQINQEWWFKIKYSNRLQPRRLWHPVSFRHISAPLLTNSTLKLLAYKVIIISSLRSSKQHKSSSQKKDRPIQVKVHLNFNFILILICRASTRNFLKKSSLRRKLSNLLSAMPSKTSSFKSKEM